MTSRAQEFEQHTIAMADEFGLTTGEAMGSLLALLSSLICVTTKDHEKRLDLVSKASQVLAATVVDDREKMQ